MQQESQLSKSNLSFNDEIQRIADKIKADVEKELNQVFKKFEVVEHNRLQNENEPERTSYSMKVKTDDNDQGHLKLQTTQPRPYSDWITEVDEFFRGSSPFDDLFNTFDPFRTGFSSIQRLADRIKSDVERELNRSFETFNVMEHHPILTDPEHTSYYMRVKTDDNGHVRVKTVKKEPGSDWQTHVEEYQRGNRPIEGQKKQQSLGGGSKKSESRRIEQGKNQEMEVEQIKDKPSGTSSTSSHSANQGSTSHA